MRRYYTVVMSTSIDVPWCTFCRAAAAMIRAVIITALSMNAVSGVDTDSTPVVIEDAALRLEIARDAAPYISRLEYKGTGSLLVSDPDDKNLFTIVIKKTNSTTETVESSRARRITVTQERTAAVQKAVMSYSGFSVPGLSADVTAMMTAGEPFVFWNIRIVNPSNSVIDAVRFPRIAAVSNIGSSDDDFFILPAFPGTLIQDPAKTWPNGYSSSVRYPGDMSAQFIAYQDGDAGIFMTARDTQGHPQSFAVTKRGRGFLLEHSFVPLSGSGAIWESPYPVAIGVTHGTWHSSADLYKQWAVQQTWCAKPLASRDDIPAWWKRGPLVYVVEVREYDKDRNTAGSLYQRLPDHVRALRQKTGGEIVPMLAGWERHRRWTAGDYFPVFDEVNAQAAIAQLRGSGFRPFVYLSGLFYTFSNEGGDGSDIPAAEQYTAHFVADETAANLKKYVLNESRPGSAWKRNSYQFCAGDPYTKKFFCDVADRAHAAGIDVLQMDQTTSGAGDICFATHHGHAPGTGLYQTTGFHDVLDSMRSRGKSNDPGFILCHEEPHEFLIPHLDGFHVREYYERQWYRGAHGAKGIPLFSYLYHEYAIGYGGDSAQISPGPNAWNVRAHAMNLVTGRTPGIAVWSSSYLATNINADQLSILRAHSRLLGTRAQECLMLGRMLHPLMIISPQLQFTAPVRKSDRGKPEDNRIIDPAILTSSWLSPAGRIGHLFVNVSRERQPLQAALDVRNAAAQGAQVHAALWRSTSTNGFEPLGTDGPLPHAWKTDLDPAEVVFVELSNMP